jgi:hypothetical protein
MNSRIREQPTEGICYLDQDGMKFEWIWLFLVLPRNFLNEKRESSRREKGREGSLNILLSSHVGWRARNCVGVGK